MELRSRSVHFKLVEESDAEFILSLRSDANLNSYLSKTDASIDDQKKWIRDYKIRETEKREFYFIICRNDNGQSVGTVRLYDFITTTNSFCWGSWILNSNKTKFAAIESAFLVYQFAFEELNFEKSHFDVRKENSKVIAFHEKMGAEKKSETELDYYFEVQKEHVYNARYKYLKFISSLKEDFK
ncbi:GNAT family N-acetyltransferase [Shewanella sp.]|uniref:GNAT family N-acetyltransferase n=1 Tax=Shewanella sp. TaxID=50422 RepID=UPI003F3C1529